MNNHILSDSEDEQQQSPNFGIRSGDDQCETAESLDIKPPQAAVRNPEKKKSSNKSKKHSKEKHKRRENNRERSWVVGSDRDTIHMENIKKHRHSTDTNFKCRRTNHDRESIYNDKYDIRERDKKIDRIIWEREKRKICEENYDNKIEAERALEDLRNRLLSKRFKYETELIRYEKRSSHYDVSRSVDYFEHRHKSHRGDKLGDQINNTNHYSNHNNSRKKEKIKSEDPEKVARRAKLLEAEREMERRKVLARDELLARRERKHEREDKRNSLISNQKWKHKSVHENKLNRSNSPKEDGEYEEKDIVEVSDNSVESSEENMQTEEISNVSDTDSEDISEKSNESEEMDIFKKDNDSKVNDNDEDDYGDDDADDDEDDDDVDDDDEDEDDDDDELLQNSPLSVDKLVKSEHRYLKKSTKRSSSIVSKTSNSEHSGSDNSESLSMSKPSSRSISLSPSGSLKGVRVESKLISKSPPSGNSDMKKMDDTVKPTKCDSLKICDPDNNSSEIIIDEVIQKLPNYFPAVQGCRSVEEFQRLNRIAEGTYGIVYRAKDKRTNEIVALKRLKMEKEKEGFPITSLREINTLLKGQHPNIVTVREIVVGSNMDEIFIVMDYVEHDLKSLMETMKEKSQAFFPAEVKCLLYQLLRAVAHLHDNWILHRDLKTSNLLLSHRGILKVGDFGLAREYGSPLKEYTPLVVTLYYRAPELLLCSKVYSTSIDMWSVGCIFAEFLQMSPIFPGKSEIDQLNRIYKELGTPNEKLWPGYNTLPAVQNLISQNPHFAQYPVSNLRRRFLNKSSEQGVILLQELLTYDPKQRLAADQALKHAYFKEMPLAIDPSMFPTWPAKSELAHRKAAALSPKPPSGGGQFKQLGRDEISSGTKKTGFVLKSSANQRQVHMAPGFSLKF